MKNLTFQCKARTVFGYVRHIILTVLFSFTLLSVFQCSGGEEIVTPPEPATSLFKDPENKFEVTIMGKPDAPIDTASSQYDFFERNDQKEIVAQTRISFIQKEVEKDADLFAPGYEDKFLAECNCVVLQRGVVLFEGRQARQYSVSLKNGEWVGFQRHFTRGKRIYILGVRGPATGLERVRSSFDETIASFHFLPVKE